MIDNMIISKEVKSIIKKLQSRGFQAYIVGGCVRDLLLRKNPQDWDIATNAMPEEIQRIFPKSFYENRFFTVGVQTGSKDPTLKIIEITTFRSEAKYTDKRHPDLVKPAKTIEEDLGRRDFTVNAMALQISDTKTEPQSISEFKIIDPFSGKNDLKNRIIRAVGNPKERFSEDALRMMRAVRLSVGLGKEWEIEKKTEKEIKNHAGLLRIISKDRIRDELEKILLKPSASEGIELLRRLGLLKFIIPELEEGYGVGQNKQHKYTVWEHNLRSLQYAAQKNYSLEVRLAALLHDVAKPRVKKGEGPNCTFYGHEVLGTKMTVAILERLRFPKQIVEKVSLLVRAHMFNYDPEVVTDSSVRRLVYRIGPENIKELVQLREADRIGHGVPKAVPYRLRHFMFRVEKVLKRPISRTMMKLNGTELMQLLNIPEGPRVGAILDLLFEDILDKPEHNQKEYLQKKALALNNLSDEELASLRKKAQEKYANLLKSKEEELKKKYWVS